MGGDPYQLSRVLDMTKGTLDPCTGYKHIRVYRVAHVIASITPCLGFYFVYNCPRALYHNFTY